MGSKYAGHALFLKTYLKIYSSKIKNMSKKEEDIGSEKK